MPFSRADATYVGKLVGFWLRQPLLRAQADVSAYRAIEMIDRKRGDRIEKITLKNRGNNELHAELIVPAPSIMLRVIGRVGSDPENVDRHGGRFAANHAASILGKADLRIRDLALSGFAAKLPEDFADLRHAGRANRMTFREQPT